MSNWKIEVNDKIKEITSKKLTFYIGDVCARKLLKEIFDNHKIDAVIHFAGYKAVGKSVKKTLMCYCNNIDIPYKIVGRHDGGIDECYADSIYAKEVLNRSFTYGIEDMVKDSYNFVKINN